MTGADVKRLAMEALAEGVLCQTQGADEGLTALRSCVVLSAEESEWIDVRLEPSGEEERTRAAALLQP